MDTTLPAMLTTEEAAEYVGARSVDQFRREVERGLWPQPFAKNSRPRRWRRSELDAILHPARPSVQDREAHYRDEADRAFGLK